jgi:hypothetical protein
MTVASWKETARVSLESETEELVISWLRSEPAEAFSIFEGIIEGRVILGMPSI